MCVRVCLCAHVRMCVFVRAFVCVCVSLARVFLGVGGVSVFLAGRLDQIRLNDIFRQLRRCHSCTEEHATETKLKKKQTI